MKTIAQIFIAIAFQLSSVAQENTLFFENGKLKADTSLSLNKDELILWSEVEEEVLSHFINNFVAPAIVIDANISVSGVIYFQYDIKIESFSFLKFIPYSDSTETTPLKLFEEAIAKAICFVPSRDTKKHLTQKSSDSKTVFYLPFAFKVPTVKSFINQNGEVSIRKARIPLVSPDRK